MKLVYVDESGSFNDSSYRPGITWVSPGVRATTHFVLTAVIMDSTDWRANFQRFKKLRQNIKDQYGVPISECLHATELVAGQEKWAHINRKPILRDKRLSLLKMMLHEYGQWGSFQIIAVAVDKGSPVSSISPATCREMAYENLLNRLNLTIQEDFMLIHDGAEDLAVIRQARKLQVMHMVNGQNRPIKHLLEDPLFKIGRHSYFLQAVDQIAYSLLHYYDRRANADLAEFVIETKILERLGVAAACHATRATLPGVVPVPTPRR